MVVRDKPAPLAERVYRMEPVAAPPEQREKVIALDRELRRGLQISAPRPSYKLVGPDGLQTEVPEAMFHLIVRVAEVLARGDAVSVVPIAKLLTTQQAADILNVSRQHLVGLLEKNDISHHKVGKHRRIKIEDLLGYKALRDARRQVALRELMRLSEEFGGYVKPDVPDGSVDPAASPSDKSST